MTDKPRPSPPEADNAVGYCRPPQHTRFQPGRSGNPKGRPKGSKNFSTLFSEELAQPVILKENGKRRRMPKRQALAKQVINKALSNDLRAAALVLDQVWRCEGSAEGPVAIEVDQPENKLVMESIIRRIRMNEEAPSGTDALKDASEEPK
jgi:Family of unknown function (DUF5681)